MKQIAYILILLVMSPVAGHAAAEPWPDGDDLLRRVRAAMPAQPIRLDAELRTQNPRGEIIRVLNARIDLDWGAPVPTAEYQIRDRFGRRRERFRISWPPGEAPVYAYAAGDPLEEAPVPNLYETIDGTEISWADLTLSFLWWRGAETVGTDRRRGRLCYVLDIPAPEEAPGGYSGVRLWVDPETHLLLQADAYDADEELARRLQVKSLRRIDEVWMVQDLDVHRFPSRNRTTLRVNDLTIQESRPHDGRD